MKKWISLLVLAVIPVAAQVPVNASSVSIKGNVVLPGMLTGSHGTDVKVQTSDGTGSVGQLAVFDSGGGLTSLGGTIIGITKINQTSNRTFGVIYQNTSSNTMFVTGYATITSGAGDKNVTCLTGPTSSVSIIWKNEVSGTIAGEGAGFGCFVLSGEYYEITVAGNYAFTPGAWWEYSGFGGLGAAAAGAGVSSLNSLTGALNIVCGIGLSCSTSGSTINIGIATAFTINSFTGCGGSLEIGQVVNNPTCSASYSSMPTSATITNSDGVNSPLTLTSPFTSGTIVGSFVKTTVASTTVTLSASNGSTQTATQTYTWNPRIFGGIGSAGATSIVIEAGTTAVLSTSDVLASAGLGAETVGQVFGPYSPNNQYIYLLLTGSSHTFVDNSTGFTIPFGSPIPVSFVNVYGVAVTMYLYRTTYTAGPGVTTNIKVAS